MLDTMPMKPYSRNEMLVLPCTVTNTTMPTTKPIKAEVAPTRGKNIPKKKSAPKPLVSRPRKVLN